MKKVATRKPYRRAEGFVEGANPKISVCFEHVTFGRLRQLYAVSGVSVGEVIRRLVDHSLQGGAEI